MTIRQTLLISGMLVLALPAAALARIAGADVQRASADQLAITWQDANPVDIYEGARPDFAPTPATAVAHASHAGSFVLDHAGQQRRYFILVDRRDNQRLEVAERAVPLAQGSNFRDIGGYVGAGGKHVRWGLIYRSAGQPMLAPGDVDSIHQLGIGQLVDLRSSEERVVAPTKIYGVPYSAVGYSMVDLMHGANGGAIHNGADMYRNFPHLLAPQLRLVFAHLLHEHTPIVYNCSAGQDRTGFVTAMILTALGVNYDTIVADYHLSTKDRRPDWEMPPIDPALIASNPGLQMFAGYRNRPDWKTPQPLMDKDGQPFLRGAFDEIRDKWGSVDAYLQQEIGVGPAQIAQLRREYLS